MCTSKPPAHQKHHKQTVTAHHRWVGGGVTKGCRTFINSSWVRLTIDYYLDRRLSVDRQTI